jgi:hypothetical protein
MAAMMETDVAEPSFMHLLAAEPTLLDPAPFGASAQVIDRRCFDEVHSCLRCGERAQQAFVAETRIGPRWLDLCMACRDWLQRQLEDQKWM